MQHHCLAALCLGLGLTASLPAQTDNWPRLRGPDGDGLAEGATLPESWSSTENVVWKTDLPGWGWSSPVIWGERLFVTAAISESEREKLVVGGYPGGHVLPTEVHRWVMYCLDVETGDVLWERAVFEGPPPEERHPKNSYANGTPVTDGRHVYAYFDNIGLFCFDLEGNPVWEQRWGSFPIRGGWGPGASPVLHEERLFFVNDNERESFAVALDTSTGDELWRVPRDEQSNWSSPYVWEHDGGTELVTIGTGKIRSYDLDGNLIWELAGTSGLVSQTPVAKEGLLYVGAGYHYGPLYAIRPGAKGDITLQDGETSNEWIAWSQPRGSSIHPGYLISNGRLYVLFDAGLLTCYDAQTGETIFPRQRLNTGGGRFYASPWAYNGRMFLLNENGTTWVVEDGPEFNVIRQNTLGEDDYAWATPAISQGSLFIRTYSGVYRLQDTETATGR